jgi:hypothetical protein
MGEEISRIIRSTDNKPETMTAKIIEAIIMISTEYNLGLKKAKIKKLAKQFLEDERYINFIVEKDGVFTYPTVRLEVWLLEKQYQSESS